MSGRPDLDSNPGEVVPEGTVFSRDQSGVSEYTPSKVDAYVVWQLNSLPKGVGMFAVHHDSGLNGAALLFQSILEGLASSHGASISQRFPSEGPLIARARKLGPIQVG